MPIEAASLSRNATLVAPASMKNFMRSRSTNVQIKTSAIAQIDNHEGAAAERSNR
jgi:hypothetical protein